MAASDILQPSAFGGASRDPEGCVDSGVARGWKLAPYPIGDSRDPGCLKRCSRWGILDSADSIAANINRAQSLKELQDGLEVHVHAAVHMQMGG